MFPAILFAFAALADEPATADAPATDAPATDGSTTDTPATDAPATDATTAEPAPDAPATDATTAEPAPDEAPPAKVKKAKKPKKGEDAPPPVEAAPAEGAPPDAPAADAAPADATPNEATATALPPSEPTADGAIGGVVDPGTPVEASPDATPELQKPPKPEPERVDGVEGWRIAAMGAGTGLRVGEDAVVGRTGGSNETTLQARAALGKTELSASLPFAAFRTPGPRQTGLGNLGLDLSRLHDGKHELRSLGVDLTVPTGGKAYTWTNRPDDLWPGGGVDLAWQGIRGTGGTRFVHRLAVGLHGAEGYAPFPAMWFRINGAVGIDQKLGDRFGVLGELSMQTWDTSPLEITAIARGRIVDGLDVRAGLVMPIGVWSGWTPSDQPKGISETTLLVDLAMSL